jgi:hypothetical protein
MSPPQILRLKSGAELRLQSILLRRIHRWTPVCVMRTKREHQVNGARAGRSASKIMMMPANSPWMSERRSSFSLQSTTGLSRLQRLAPRQEFKCRYDRESNDNKASKLVRNHGSLERVFFEIQYAQQSNDQPQAGRDPSIASTMGNLRALASVNS